MKSSSTNGFLCSISHLNFFFDDQDFSVAGMHQFSAASPLRSNSNSSNNSLQIKLIKICHIALYFEPNIAYLAMKQAKSLCALYAAPALTSPSTFVRCRHPLKKGKCLSCGTISICRTSCRFSGKQK